jgi:outer membrane lipoprotein-sorting protein
VTVPSTPPTVTAPAASAQAALGQFAAAWARVTAYTATVTVFERKDTQVQNVVLEYTFRKPSSVTVHVDAGPNAGVTTVWGGGTTVVAHRGSGLAALFKKTFSLHDPQVTTIRGSSIDQLSFGAILAHAQQEAGTLTQISEPDIGGAAVDAVTLMLADPKANAGLTREVIELSRSTHLPVQVLAFDGTTLVRQIDFSKVVLEQ